MKHVKNDLIPTFYEAMEDKGNLTLAEVEEALLTPWLALKEGTDTGYLPMFRFQHFGCFMVRLGKARHLLREMESRRGIETGRKLERHQREIVMLRDYIQRQEARENAGRHEDTGDAKEDDD